MVMAPTIFTNWTGPWDYLNAGDIFNAAVSPYANMFGTVVWLYLLVFFTGLTMAYIKTKNFGTTIVVGLVVCAGFFPFMAATEGYEAAMPVVYLMIVLGIFGILYRFFK